MKQKSLLLSLLILLFACTPQIIDTHDESGEDSNGAQGRLRFEYNHSGMDPIFSVISTDSKTLFSQSLSENAKQVMITIEDAGNNLVYDKKIISLHKFGSSYVSESIPFTVGSYTLTEYLIIDETGDVIMAAPINGSEAAQLVTTPLPITFSVTEEQTTSVIPQVIDIQAVENADPVGFGYSTFGFELFDTFDWLITLSAYDASADAMLLTSGEMTVKNQENTIFSASLTAETNRIFINDGYSEYLVIVKKAGYKDYMHTFTNSELKGYAGMPLNVTLLETSPDLGKVWYQATPNAAWSDRSEFAGVVYNNKMWIIGGLSNTGRLNDVWSSTDGITWTEETSNAAFPARNGHQVTVYAGKIWIIGGGGDNGILNDVWYSTDGIIWTEAAANAAIAEKGLHGMVVFNNKMWLIAGKDIDWSNNVYSSTDGVNWTLETDNPGFVERYGHRCTIFNNKIFLIGGATAPSWGRANDIHSTEDGITWNLVNGNPIFSSRADFGLVNYSGKLWLFGGENSNQYYNDVYSSADGNNWTLETVNAGFPGRWRFVTLVYDNRIWILGGNSSGVKTSDVWFTY